MRNPVYFLMALVPLFTLWFCTASSGKEKQNPDNRQPGFVKATNKNRAVLELFTSQGCSSCPPADRLLGTYTSNENIVALSFHVDYWDRLGWKDPFSSKAFTERQNMYASALRSDLYTPQLVINGQTEMIGSDQAKISSGIQRALAQEPGAEISIKTLKTEKGRVTINFAPVGNTTGCVVNIAIVEKKTTTEIKAGENGGNTLANYNVVRTFKTIDGVDNGDNTKSIDIPAEADQKNITVIVFLQQKASHRILAADQAEL